MKEEFFMFNQKVFYLLVLLMLIGCGVQVNSESKQIHIPEKISVEIPAILNPKKDKSNGKQEKIKIDRVEGQASGYRSVTHYISKLIRVVDEMKSNLLMGNHVIEDVEKRCQKIPLDEVCTIPANSLSLIIDKQIIKQLGLLLGDDYLWDRDIDSVIGKRVFFGEIEFIKHDSNSTYQYSLNMDMSKIIDIISYDNVYKSIQKIQWAEDREQILSSLSKEISNSDSSSWTLHYHNESAEESMHLNDNITDYTSGITNRVFSLIKHPKEGSYDTTLNSIKKISFMTNDNVVETKFSSLIKLEKEKGFQKFTQTDSANSYYKINREEIFDGNGSLVATTYCDSDSSECSLYDKSTWYIDNSESLFEPLKKMEFEELKITGGELKNGEYLLLPKKYNIKNMTIQEVLDAHVGEFVVLNDSMQGILYSEKYRTRLDELQLLHTVYNTQLNLSLKEKKIELFEVVKEKSLPNLNLWSLQ